MKRNIFRSLDVAQFLRSHWQKKPLVVRGALPEYAERISRSDLFALAAREEVESRLVARTRGRWNVRHGPFARSEIRKLPRTGWTLLVQSVDHAIDGVAQLLRE